MRLRIALTLICAAALGVYAYTAEKYEYSGGIFEDLHASALFDLSVMALAVAAGSAVRRLWVLLALLGPLLALGYLQVTGYVSPWNDGNEPLSSAPGLFFFLWFGALLLIGLVLGHARERGRPTASQTNQ